MLPNDPRRIAVVGSEPPDARSAYAMKGKLRAVLGEFTTNRVRPTLVTTAVTALVASTEARKLGWSREAVGQGAGMKADRIAAQLERLHLLVVVGDTMETTQAAGMARARHIPVIHVK